MERVAIKERGPVAGLGQRSRARNGLGWLGREQIRRSVVVVAHEVALDEAVDGAGDLLEQPDDIVVPRRRQRMKRNGIVRVCREDTVGKQGVGVAI